MTLPDERYRAIQHARNFLRDLLVPSKTPRVPRAIRIQARNVLRHFPWSTHVDELAKRAPSIIKNPYKD